MSEQDCHAEKDAALRQRINSLEAKVQATATLRRKAKQAHRHILQKNGLLRKDNQLLLLEFRDEKDNCSAITSQLISSASKVSKLKESLNLKVKDSLMTDILEQNSTAPETFRLKDSRGHYTDETKMCVIHLAGKCDVAASKVGKVMPIVVNNVVTTGDAVCASDFQTTDSRHFHGE